MCVPLVAFLSTIVLRSASAGGVYCAETARARAAALGWDYPGVHGAAASFGPVHHAVHPQPHIGYGLVETEANGVPYKQNQPGGSPFDDTIYRPDSLLLSDGIYEPIHSEHATVLRFPRGQSVSNDKTSFEEVKYVAPPTLAEAPGQSDLVNWDPQGLYKPLPFVYNEHDLVPDKFAPNRRGMSLSGLPLPQSRGHGAYQTGLTGHFLRREVPVLGSSRFITRGHTREVKRRGPVYGIWKRPVFPALLAPYRHRRLNPFVKGNSIVRRLIKPKLGL